MTRGDFVSAKLSRALQTVLRPDTQQIVLTQFRARGQKSITLLIVALLLALWAAASVIKSLLQGFNAAYRIPRSRSFFHETGVAIGLVFLAAVPMVGASTLVLFGPQVERPLLGISRIHPLPHPLPPLSPFPSLLGPFPRP